MSVLAAMGEREPRGIAEAIGRAMHTSATCASARTVRAPTPGTSSSSAKSRGPAFGRGREIAVQAPRDDVFGPDVVMGGHDEMRQQRLGVGSRRSTPLGSSLASCRAMPSGPSVAEHIELPLPRDARRAGRSG